VTAEATARAPAGDAGFRLPAEDLPDLILLAFDDALRIWAATGAALAARGWTSDQFVGKTVPEVGRSEDAAITEAYCRAALRAVIGGMLIARDVTEQRRAERQILASRHHMRTNPDPYAFEHQMVTLDGTVRTLMARGEGVVDGDGRVVRFIGTTQDITDRRRAEAERRRALGRVYAAQEGHDRRLAADLHDGHVQSLAAIGFKLEQTRLRLGASAAPEVDELLWQVTKDLSTEVTSLRRTIGRLRPLVLVEDGLEAALREEAKSACNRAVLVACEVVSELEGRLDPVVETALFRVAQQALANIVDHASATRALVAIECSEKGVVLRVSHDGCGFDADHVQVLADVAHCGLIAMRERVEALGGRFRITTAAGEGTVVEARLPLTDPTEGLGL
jgi:signal transduction histidine kinase